MIAVGYYASTSGDNQNYDDGEYCSAISGYRSALLSLVVDDLAMEQTLVSDEPTTCYYTFELTASSFSLVIPPTPAPTPAPVAGSIDNYGGAVAYASDGTYCYKVVIGDGVAYGGGQIIQNTGASSGCESVDYTVGGTNVYAIGFYASTSGDDQNYDDGDYCSARFWQ